MKTLYYYAQYAHARICSILRQAEEKNLTIDDNQDFSSHHLKKKSMC